jgi:outer membrane receptor protein involved in Fe transport
MTTYNAASARYRGIVLSANTGITRSVSFDASFDVQSAAYLGVPQDILIANTALIDGGQIYGVPLRQGTAGLSYQDNDGVGARLDATYIGGQQLVETQSVLVCQCKPFQDQRANEREHGCVQSVQQRRRALWIYRSLRSRQGS